MPNKIKLLSILLTLLLVISACSGPSSPAQDAGGDASSSDAAASESSDDAETGGELDVVTGEDNVLTDADANLAQLSEAPMLAEMVAAGDLPPVEERLPIASDINVVEVVEEIGQYGGTWFAVAGSPSLSTIKMKLYDPPVRWREDYKRL